MGTSVATPTMKNTTTNGCTSRNIWGTSATSMTGISGGSNTTCETKTMYMLKICRILLQKYSCITGTLGNASGTGYISQTTDSGTTSQTITCYYGQSVTLPTSGASAVTGYSWDGKWRPSSTTTSTVASTTCRLQALYPNCSTTITWNKNGGTGTTSGATTNNSGTTSSTTTCV